MIYGFRKGMVLLIACIVIGTFLVHKNSPFSSYSSIFEPITSYPFIKNGS